MVPDELDVLQPFYSPADDQGFELNSGISGFLHASISYIHKQVYAPPRQRPVEASPGPISKV